jgi:cell division protein FtsW
MRKMPNFDTVLAATVLFLLIFGLVMITSIGVPKSISLSAPGVLYPNCSDANVDCYLLFKNHLVRLAIGAIGFLIAFKLPIKFWKKIAGVLFGITFLALLLVLFAGKDFGTIATNWLMFFNTSVQPSEFAKLAVILYLAYWFSKRKEAVESFKDGFLPFCFISAIILLAVIVVTGVSHVRERFVGFMQVGQECRETYCWQSEQASIAVGSGGFWGKGLTQGVQKSYWLPQASDDFIFAASAEELGFIRIIFVIIAYLIIAIRGYIIANKAENSFEKYVAVGITTWITMQAFINIGVNTSIIPVTGITLPFVNRCRNTFKYFTKHKILCEWY